MQKCRSEVDTGVDPEGSALVTEEATLEGENLIGAARALPEGSEPAKTGEPSCTVPRRQARRDFLKTAAAAASALALGGWEGCVREESGTGAVQDIEKKPYNIVIFSLDSLAANHLGCHGYPRRTSPNIDRFSRRCFKFENAITPCGWTLPSYSSLFTGLYPLSHRVRNSKGKLSNDALLFTEVLNENNYATLAFSEPGWVTPEFGLDQGFERFHLASGRFDELRWDIAFRQLNELRKAERPFFLFFYTNDLHSPYEAVNPSDNAFLQQEDTLYDKAELEIAQQKGDEGIPQNRLIEGVPMEIGAYTAQYDAGILYLDAQLSRFFDFLDAEDMRENTIVIFTADHGEIMAEHGKYFCHGGFYDSVLKVPFLMYLPHTEARQIKAQIQLIDIAPTLFELCRIPPPDMEGVSFLPLLTGAKDSIREFAYTSYMFEGVIQSLSWKLVKRGLLRKKFPNEGRFLGPPIPDAKNYLFNLLEDTKELRNLYYDPGFRQTREFWEGRLDKLEIALNTGEDYRSFSESSQLKPETIKHLRALGYLQ